MSQQYPTPHRPGFPQAFAAGPYQPVSQFTQFSTAGPQNGIPSVPAPFPQPAATPHIQQPSVSAACQGYPQYSSNGFPATSHIQSFIASGPPQVPSPSVSVNGTGPPAQPSTLKPSFPTPLPPNFPTPKPLVSAGTTTVPPSRGIAPGVPPAFAASQSAVYPGSRYPTSVPVASPLQPMPPAVSAPSQLYASNIHHPPSSQAQPLMLNQSMNQMQQNFGQMTMQQFPQTIVGAYPPVGATGTNFGDVLDLLSVRNVVDMGFDDVEVTIPSQKIAKPDVKMDSNIFRCTMNVLPVNEDLLKKVRLPFGLTLHPFRDMKKIFCIQPSTIVRCSHCRAYINPYVHLVDSRRWRCNLCNYMNNLPDDFCWDHATKSFGDPLDRPEMNNATVEFIAPSDYMIRPPQPAIYVFILDVSASALESGYLCAFTEQLLLNLDQMPHDDRTQIAFMCIDSCIHFFQFSQNLPTRQMTLSEVDDAFLPSNSGLLVNFKQFKEEIRLFVRQLPNIFETSSMSHNCLGTAITLAHELIKDQGGRVTVFQCSLPDIGLGCLQQREDPSKRAAEADEVTNLGPATDFYKRLALEASSQQVCFDLFMLNTTYADLASLSEIAKFTGGSVHHFPNYHWINDFKQVQRFEKVFTRYLTRKIGFEAVLRIRCSRGLAVSAFHGNFFVRSTDLLVLPNVNPDSAIAVEISMEEKLGPVAVFQAALLYTSSKGDRRIRVHTLCLPTASDPLSIYNGFDLKATVSLLGKISVERSMTGNPLSHSREGMIHAVVDSLGAYKRAVGSACRGLPAPRKGHLRLFPLYALAMLKHQALSSGRSVKLDMRVGSMLVLRSASLDQILSELYPNMYRLNEIMQFADEQWPSPLPLSFEHVHRDGLYLLEAGNVIILYVSSGANEKFVTDLFGCSYHQIDERSFRELPNSLNEKVHSFVKYVTYLKPYLGPVRVITEDCPRRDQFVQRMIEDRTESSHSYVEFLQHVKREMDSS